MRRKNDAYYTLQSDIAIGALLRYAQVKGQIIEPCVGESHLAEALLLKVEPRSQIWSNDIDPNVRASYHLDAAREADVARIADRCGPWDWVKPKF